MRLELEDGSFIEVSDEDSAYLEDYSAETGKSVPEIVHEALELWRKEREKGRN